MFISLQSTSRESAKRILDGFTLATMDAVAVVVEDDGVSGVVDSNPSFGTIYSFTPRDAGFSTDLSLTVSLS